ncbi:MAG TPA: hypothetical protein VHS28_01345 [Chloroflexota bacterium]|nr:hypothetical protein [Chloroflexota bacterium]
MSLAPVVLDVYQHLSEHVQVFQNPAGPTHDCLERIFRDIDLNAGSLGDQLSHAREERASTGQRNASGHHIGY